MARSLPAPRIDWDPVYELLRCLGEASEAPEERAFQSVALIASMQANAPIDQWLLQELLALARLDVGEEDDLDAIASPLGILQGAGLLEVQWMEGSPLHQAATEPEDIEFGRENRLTLHRQVLDQMRRVERALTLAMEAVESAEDEDDWR